MKETPTFRNILEEITQLKRLLSYIDNELCQEINDNGDSSRLKRIRRTNYKALSKITKLWNMIQKKKEDER